MGSSVWRKTNRSNAASGERSDGVVSEFYHRFPLMVSAKQAGNLGENIGYKKPCSKPGQGFLLIKDEEIYC